MDFINTQDVAETLKDTHNLWAAFKLGIIGAHWTDHEKQGFLVEFQTVELGLTGITPKEAVHRGREFIQKYISFAPIEIVDNCLTCGGAFPQCQLTEDNCLCPTCEAKRIADEERWQRFLENCSWEPEPFRPPTWARRIGR